MIRLRSFCRSGIDGLSRRRNVRGGRIGSRRIDMLGLRSFFQFRRRLVRFPFVDRRDFFFLRGRLIRRSYVDVFLRALVHMRTAASGNGGDGQRSGSKNSSPNSRKTNRIHGHDGRVYTYSLFVQPKNRNVAEASSVLSTSDNQDHEVFFLSFTRPIEQRPFCGTLATHCAKPREQRFLFPAQPGRTWEKH